MWKIDGLTAKGILRRKNEELNSRWVFTASTCFAPSRQSKVQLKVHSRKYARVLLKILSRLEPQSTREWLESSCLDFALDSWQHQPETTRFECTELGPKTTRYPNSCKSRHVYKPKLGPLWALGCFAAVRSATMAPTCLTTNLYRAEPRVNWRTTTNCCFLYRFGYCKHQRVGIHPQRLGIHFFCRPSVSWSKRQRQKSLLLTPKGMSEPWHHPWNPTWMNYAQPAQLQIFKNLAL